VPDIVLDLGGIKDWMLPQYRPLLANKSRYLVLCSGSGTGKSYFAAQKVVYETLTHPGCTVYIVRKVFKTIKNSMLPLIIKVVKDLGFERYMRYNSVEGRITFLPPFCAEIVSLGMDNSEKIKSLFGTFIIWAEEATELSLQDFTQLDLRLRGSKELQMILTTNPVGGKRHWLYKKFFQARESMASVYCPTIDGNKYIDSQYLRVLENISNKEQKDIYYHGKWVDLTGQIYTNWSLIDPPDMRYAGSYEQGLHVRNANNRSLWDNMTTEAIGIDFGYNNPTTVIYVGIRDDAYYIRELLYKSHMTNNELIEQLNCLHLKKDIEIFGDSAEPARIQEIKNAGYNIHPAKKDVMAGIDALKNKKMYVTKDSSDTIKELETYCWATDKDGKALDRPVEYMDHAMDAIRYAVYSKTCGDTFDPSKPIMYSGGYSHMPV